MLVRNTERLSQRSAGSVNSTSGGALVPADTDQPSGLGFGYGLGIFTSVNGVTVWTGVGPQNAPQRHSAGR